MKAVSVKELKKELKTLQENNIKLITIGNIEYLPKKAQIELADVIEKTKKNLIKQLLVVDPNVRISCAKIMDHPWIVGKGNPQVKLPESF